jgi:glutamyl-tRNA synthetase
VPALERLQETVPLVRERLKKLSDFAGVVGFLFMESLDYDPKLLIPPKCTREQVINVLRASGTVLTDASQWLSTVDVMDRPMPFPTPIAGHRILPPLFEDVMRKEAEDYNMKPGDVFMIHRVALTGKTASPPLLETMKVLGPEETYKRLIRALEKTKALQTP